MNANTSHQRIPVSVVSDTANLSPSQNLADIFDSLAEKAPQRKILTAMNGPSVSDGDRTWSRSDFAKDLRAVSRVLIQCGMNDDSRMAILLPSIPEFHLLLWGGISVCAVAPINPLLQFEQVRQLMSTMGASLIALPSQKLHPGLWKLGVALKEAIPTLRVLTVGPESELTSLLPLARSDATELPTRSTDSIAGLFHTGGTTGNPKVAPLTLKNILSSAGMLDSVLKCSEDDVFVSPLPLFHIAGAIVGGLAPLLSGSHLVMPSPMGLRDPNVIANFWRTLAHYKATMLAAVPTSISALLDAPIGDADLSSLNFVLTGTAALPSETARRFTSLTGKPIYTGYGMTETAGTVAFTPRGSGGMPSSVGKLVAPMEVRVVPISSNAVCSIEMATGEAGRVLVRGPNVFSGYLDTRRSSSPVGEDGWFDTGDIGFLDVGKNLTLTGRTKDLIIRSGHNIDPGVIEEVALNHLSIASAAAVGQIDGYAGEVPVLFVQLKPSAKDRFNIDEFFEFLIKHIPEPPARPRFVYLLDQIPLTAVGKIFKPPLRIQAAEAKLTEVLEKLKISASEVSLGVLIVENGRLAVSVSTSKALNTNQAAALQRELMSLPVDLTYCSPAL